MPEINFWAPAVPIAQPRQRTRVMRIGKRAVAQNYTPADSPVNAFKATVRAAFAQSYSGPPLDGPLTASISFLFPRPTAKQWTTKAMPREWHDKKPDVDNLIKAVLDALNGLAFQDDKQVVQLGMVQKLICAGDETPGVRIVIRRLGSY